MKFRLVFLLVSLPLKGLFSILNGLSTQLSNPVLGVLGMIVWIAWFVTLWLAATSETKIELKWTLWLSKISHYSTLILAVIGVIIISFSLAAKANLIEPDTNSSFVNSLILTGENSFHYNDSTAMDQQAVTNVLNGKNPYVAANIVTAMEQVGASLNAITPLHAGTFAGIFPYPSQAQLTEFWQSAGITFDQIRTQIESRFNYPAGSFLLAAPFFLIGLADMHWVVLIFLIAGLIYAFLKIPKSRRLIFLVAVAASIELWGCLVSGDNTVLAFPFIMVGWLLLRERPMFAMSLIGVAAATKQTSWFLIPFALILLIRFYGWKYAIAGVAAAAGVFLLLNLPFFINNPSLWLDSVFAPLKDAMYPFGTGLVVLVSKGFLNIQNPLPFTVLELSTLLGGIVWYFFHAKRYPQAGLLLSILPFFFAWRSLNNYFYFVDLVLLAEILIAERLFPSKAKEQKLVLSAD